MTISSEFMPAGFLRSPERLHRARSQLLLIDLQERLVAAMPKAERTVAAAGLLTQASCLFDVPVTVTEQSPQKLGTTVSPLLDGLHGKLIPVSKTTFSAIGVLGWPAVSDRDDGRDQVVLAGLETHVCVLQTACDLIALGYRVFVAGDACSSRFKQDAKFALRRLRDLGTAVTTVEAIVFDWCETADDPQFRALSQLVKQRSRKDQPAESR